MHTNEYDRSALSLAGIPRPGTRFERAIDRLMEVLVAVAGTRSWAG